MGPNTLPKEMVIVTIDPLSDMLHKIGHYYTFLNITTEHIFTTIQLTTALRLT